MPKNRSRWNQQPVPPSDKVCDSLMIVAPRRWQLAEAIIAGLYVASEELKGGPPSDLYVRDEGWGNALILREPVPEQFVLALLAAMPQAELVPVDFGLCPSRPLMSIGRHGVTMYSDPIVPGFTEPARDSGSARGVEKLINCSVHHAWLRQFRVSSGTIVERRALFHQTWAIQGSKNEVWPTEFCCPGRR